MTDPTGLIAQADAELAGRMQIPARQLCRELRDALAAALTRAEAHDRELFDVARVAIEMQMDATDGQHVNPQRAVDEVVAARAALAGGSQP